MLACYEKNSYNYATPSGVKYLALNPVWAI